MSQSSLSAQENQQSVEVWLTLPDQSKKLANEPALAFSSSPAENFYTIEVDENTRYQVMEGFGAAMTDSSAWLLMRLLNEAQRTEAFNNLFTREGTGIGISYVRIPVGASDFALHDFSHDDMQRGETDPKLEHYSINYDEAYIIPALQRAYALNPQLRFMASPWSAPAWMKDNGNFHGGSLLPEYYQAYADYLVNFIQAYAEHGIIIDSITPQNEPMFETPNYPTMHMSAQEQAVFVRDFLGPSLQAANLNTRIIIFDHNWDLYQYPLEVLEDPATVAFVDGVAFHCYGGDVSMQARVHEAHPELGIWFTECSGGDWATDFGGNLNWNIRHLGVRNFRNWGNSLMLWNLALDETSGPKNGGCSDCRGVITVDQTTGNVTYNEEYYVLGHLSRFVDAGAYRIESTEYIEGQPENVAFVNPDGSIVLVVQASRSVDFTVSWQGQSFSYHLPAGAVVTFKWAGLAN